MVASYLLWTAVLMCAGLYVLAYLVMSEASGTSDWWELFLPIGFVIWYVWARRRGIAFVLAVYSVFLLLCIALYAAVAFFGGGG